MSQLSLQDIVGQGEAIERLQRSVQTGKLPHALLFAGPAGVGRRTTALALAEVLLCEDPSSPKGYRLVGDADFDALAEVASFITPVPGGVGPLTVAMLLRNTVKVARSSQCEE